MRLKYTISGTPVTKKNHMQMARSKDGRTFPVQNKAYKAYESFCVKTLMPPKQPIETPVTLSAIYYMPTKRKVDLCNLLAATCDIFVKCGIIADDNSNIVVSHDGSRVRYDKENPRVEVVVEDYWKEDIV